MERLVSIDSLKIVPHDRRSLAPLGMTWGVTLNVIGLTREGSFFSSIEAKSHRYGYKNCLNSVIPAQAEIYFRGKVMNKFGDIFPPVRNDTH